MQKRTERSMWHVIKLCSRRNNKIKSVNNPLYRLVMNQIYQFGKLFIWIGVSGVCHANRYRNFVEWAKKKKKKLLTECGETGKWCIVWHTKCTEICRHKWNMRIMRIWYLIADLCNTAVILIDHRTQWFPRNDEKYFQMMYSLIHLLFFVWETEIFNY